MADRLVNLNRYSIGRWKLSTRQVLQSHNLAAFSLRGISAEVRSEMLPKFVIALKFAQAQRHRSTERNFAR